jgi:hypothetical protein
MGRDGNMPEQSPQDSPDDLEDLARRYVDLWQDQVTALASDPAFADSLQKVMAAMGVAASGFPAMWSAWPAAMASLMAAAQNPARSAAAFEEEKVHGKPEGAPARGRRDGPGPAGAPPGAAAAAASPDGGGPDLGLLEERLAALEQRVLALEAGPRRAGSRAKKKPRQG